MKTVSSLFRRGAWALGLAVVFAHHAVLACPGCKQVAADGSGNAPSLNGRSVGFGLSIFLMIGMVVALLSFLGLMMNRYCRVIAAHQRAQMEAEDAALGLRA